MMLRGHNGARSALLNEVPEEFHGQDPEVRAGYAASALRRIKADVWDESSKATSEAIFSSLDARGVCISWVIPTNPYRESEG